MYPVDEEFKHEAEQSLTGAKVVLYFESTSGSKGSYRDLDITEECIGDIKVKYALHGTLGGYAVNISPVVTVTVLQSKNLDDILNNLAETANLNIKIDVYNLIGDRNKKAELFSGVLLKRESRKLDMLGEVIDMTFCHPLVKRRVAAAIEDPYGIPDSVWSIDQTTLRRRDAIRILDTFNEVDEYKPVTFKYWHGDTQGVEFFDALENEALDVALADVQETHTPVSREKNKGKPNAYKFRRLDSTDENLVKVRGLAWHDTENILIVGIDEIQVDPGTMEVTHVPKIVYFDFNEGALHDRGPAGFLRMESYIHKLYYTGDVKKGCPDGYRVLDLEYSSGKVYGVIEAATDNLDDGVQHDYGKGLWEFKTENSKQGEKYSRCYLFSFDWANRKKDNSFDSWSRFRKYHKGVRVYSKRTVWTSPSKIEKPDGWRGCHVAEMIGHGTPATERKVGIPILLNYLIGKADKIYKDAKGYITDIDFEYIAHRRTKQTGDPDIKPRERSAYISKNNHIGLLTGYKVIALLAPYKELYGARGGFQYLSKIGDVKPLTGTHRFRIALKPPVPEFPVDPVEGIKDYVIIYHKDEHPEPCITIPECTDIKLNYVDKKSWPWATRTDVLVEKRIQEHPTVNYFFNPRSNLDALDEGAMLEGGPGLYSFTASPPIEGYMTTLVQKVLKAKEKGYGYEVKKLVERGDGSWTSDYPLPFWIDYQFIDDAAQFLPHRGFYVCNNDTNNNAIKPDAGRASPHVAPYDSLVVLNDAGTLRPVKVDTGGYLTAKGNIYLWENPNNEDVWFFCNDFSEARWPPDSHTGIEWYLNCKIYKWNASKNRAHLIFQDRDLEPYKSGYYNKLGKEFITSETKQPVNPARLFTGNGIVTVDPATQNNVIVCPCKTLRYSRENTGIKIIGAAHPEYGQEWGMPGYKSCITGAHAILVLQGDVSERFDEGDNIEVRWENETGPHITYRVVNIEVIARDLKTAFWTPSRYGVVHPKFTYGGIWTLITIDSVHLPAVETPQEQIIKQFCYKPGFPVTEEKYYYIYKVGTKWEYPTLHKIETFHVGDNSVQEFRESETPLSVNWSDAHDLRLPGERYKTLDPDYVAGEVLTPERTDEYRGLPYATLSKERFDYYSWLKEINDLYADFEHRYNYLTIKNSQMKLRAKLIFNDKDIDEPDLATCLIKPNCGDNKTECRIFFNRKFEGVEVCFDYNYFAQGHYVTGMGTWGDRSYAAINSVDDPKLMFDVVLVFYALAPLESKFITQGGIVGKPAVCGDRLVMLTKPDNILATVALPPEGETEHRPYYPKWAGYIETLPVANKRVWDIIGNMAKALNSYAVPNNVRYNNNGNRNCVTFYPRYFRGNNAAVFLDPVTVRRIKNVDYTQVVCNYAHGKAIMERSGRELKYAGTRGVIPANKYEFNCDLISNYGHAMALVKSTFDWLLYKREYELDLGYLASWLQILDVVKFDYRNGQETGFIIGVDHTVKESGNGLTKLRFISYTDAVGKPFGPGGVRKGT